MTRGSLCCRHSALQRFALLGLIGTCGCAESADTPEVLLEKGRMLVERGSAEKAIPIYQQGLAKAPEHALLHYNLAVAYGELEQFDKALQEYNETLRINPRESRAYANRAAIYGRQGQSQKAIDDATEALRLKPDDAYAYRNRGSSYQLLGEWQQALLDFSAALKISPHDSVTLLERGNTLLELKRYDDALTDLNRSLEISPKEAAAFVLRGRVHRNLGHSDLADADFRTARQLDPQIEIPEATEAVSSGAPPIAELRANVIAALTKRGCADILVPAEPGLSGITAFYQGHRVSVKVTDPTGRARFTAAELAKWTASPGILVRLKEGQVVEVIPQWNPPRTELVPVEFEWSAREK